MTAKQRARLRQVGFAALDHEAAVRTATGLLALGPGFGDPLLAAVGLTDFTAPVGPDTYLEVLAPTTPDHAVARWLHPLDVGVLLELGEFVPREAWFWDELPAAQAAHASRTSRADDILAVDVHATDRVTGPGQHGELCHTLIRFV